MGLLGGKGWLLPSGSVVLPSLKAAVVMRMRMPPLEEAHPSCLLLSLAPSRRKRSSIIGKKLKRDARARREAQAGGRMDAAVSHASNARASAAGHNFGEKLRGCIGVGTRYDVSAEWLVALAVDKT